MQNHKPNWEEKKKRGGTWAMQGPPIFPPASVSDHHNPVTYPFSSVASYLLKPSASQ